MSKFIVTAKLVETTASDQTLYVPKDAIITPLAVDVAAERNVTIARQDAADHDKAVPQPQKSSDPTEDLVRLVVQRILSGGEFSLNGVSPAENTGDSVAVKSSRDVDCDEPTEYSALSDASSRGTTLFASEPAKSVGLRLLTFQAGAFHYTHRATRMWIVTEGCIHISSAHRKTTAYAGDVVRIPSSTEVSIDVPAWAKLVVVELN